MPRIVATASETTLSNLARIDRQQIAGILRDAGLSPVSVVKRKTGEFRLWPKVRALRILRTSGSAAIRRARDREAAARARLMELRDGVASGALAPVIDLEEWLDQYVRRAMALLRHLPRRVCRDVAAVNAKGLPEAERRERLRAIFAPTLDQIRQLRETIPWKS